MSRFISDLKSFGDELRRRHVVRVATAYGIGAFVVLQAAELLFEGLLVPSWVYRALTVATLAGFPIVLVVAWVYEWTARGFEREEDLSPERAAMGPKVRAYAFVGLGMVIAVVTLGLTVPYVANRSVADGIAPAASGGDPAVTPVANRPLKANAIAVLPLARLTTGEDEAAFGEGLVEDVTTALAQSSSLDVVSRTTTSAYYDTEKSAREIAAELGVGLILEGSVRRAGTKVRVTMQLIDARTDRHEWAESYDRDLGDVFGVQSELAQTIAAAVQSVIAPDRRDEAIQNRLAYDYEEAARRQLERGGEVGQLGATEVYRAWLSTDSMAARAHAGLAETLVRPSAIDDPAAMDSAARHADIAVRYNPELPEAHVARALVYAAQENVDSARVSLGEAIRLSGSDLSSVQSWRSQIEELAPQLKERVQVLVRMLPDSAVRGTQPVPPPPPAAAVRRTPQVPAAND